MHWDNSLCCRMDIQSNFGCKIKVIVAVDESGGSMGASRCAAAVGVDLLYWYQKYGNCHAWQRKLDRKDSPRSLVHLYRTWS